MELPSHIVEPDGIVLQPSKINKRTIGAWCTVDIQKGTLFGPFKGEIVKENERKRIDFRFAWEVYDLDTNELVHIVNATDPAKGDWTRYVNCARYLEEQNLVSVQEGMLVYYKAIRDIPAGEELLTWFERSRIKGNRKLTKKTDQSKESSHTVSISLKKKGKRTKSDSSLGLGNDVAIREKRQRKKKKLYDQEEVSFNELIPKKRGRKFSDPTGLKLNSVREAMVQDLKPGLISKTPEAVKVHDLKIGKGEKVGKNSGEKEEKKRKTSALKEKKTKLKGKKRMKREEKMKKQDGEMEAVKEKKDREKFDEERIKEVESNWKYPLRHNEYQFEILGHFAISMNHRRMYKCDICAGLYRHTFSLKRHYLRNHINCCYLNKGDITNCMITCPTQYLSLERANSAEIMGKVKNRVRMPKEKESKTDNRETDKTQHSVSATNEGAEKVETGMESLPVKTENCDAMKFPGLYRCNVCSRLFDERTDLLSHTKDHPILPDAKLFACTHCNMTFRFKMNLVRHQLVHQGQGRDAMEGKKVKVKVKEGMKELPYKNDDPKKPYGCLKCNMKFKCYSNLEQHEKSHSDLKEPCNCTVCGKTFPSKANLNKHMHKHTGCNVPCRSCDAVFTHVGGLRKHIRISHPEIHKERLRKLLEKKGKLGAKAMALLMEDDRPTQQEKKESTEEKKEKRGRKPKPKMSLLKCQDRESETTITDLSITGEEASRSSENTVTSIEQGTEKGKSDCEKENSTKNGDSVLTLKKEKKSKAKFEDGIDSRFKFSCVICKKRFTEYLNMCRHRRVAHENPEKLKYECGLANRAGERLKSLDDADQVEESPEEVAAYYATVAYNIAENLNCYLDGGQDAVANCKSLIKSMEEEEKEEVGEKEDDSEDEGIQWEQYNFPQNYDVRLLSENFEYDPTDPQQEKEVCKPSRNYFEIDENSLDDRSPAQCLRRRGSRESRDDRRQRDNSRGRDRSRDDSSSRDFYRDDSSSRDYFRDESPNVSKDNGSPPNIKGKVDDSSGLDKEDNTGTDDVYNDNQKKDTENDRLCLIQDGKQKIKYSQKDVYSEDSSCQSLDCSEDMTNEDIHDTRDMKNKDVSEDVESNTSTKFGENSANMVTDNDFTECVRDTSVHVQHSEDVGEDDSARVLKIKLREDKVCSDSDGRIESEIIAENESKGNGDAIKKENRTSGSMVREDTVGHVEDEEEDDSDHGGKESVSDKDDDPFVIKDAKMGEDVQKDGEETSEKYEKVKEIKIREDVRSDDEETGDKNKSGQFQELKISDDEILKIDKDNGLEIKEEKTWEGRAETASELVDQCRGGDECQKKVHEMTDTKEDLGNDVEGDGHGAIVIGLKENIHNLMISDDEREIVHTSANTEDMDRQSKIEVDVPLLERVGNLSQIVEDGEKSVVQASWTMNIGIGETSVETTKSMERYVKSEDEEQTKSEEQIVDEEQIVGEGQTEGEEQIVGEGQTEGEERVVDEEQTMSEEQIMGETASGRVERKIDLYTHLANDDDSGMSVSSVDAIGLVQHTDDAHPLLKGLQLAKGRVILVNGKEVGEGGQKENPFHEYESIKFGSLGDPVYVCSVCKRHYDDFDRLIRHQWKKHPSINCHFMEVEQGLDIEDLFYSEPCSRGILGTTGKALERALNKSSYTCSRCKGSFKSPDRLRVHIVNCATPSPTPKKKKYYYYKRKTPTKPEEVSKGESPTKDMNLKELNAKLKQLASGVSDDEKMQKIAGKHELNEGVKAGKSKDVDRYGKNEKEGKGKESGKKSGSKLKRFLSYTAKTPEKRAAKTPEKRELKTPEKRVAKTPEKREVKTPEKREVKTPEKRVVNMPEKRVAKTPEKREAESPEKREVKTPLKRESVKTEMKLSAGKGKLLGSEKLRHTEEFQEKIEDISIGNQVFRHRRRKHMNVTYNPSNHVRRRELTEVLDKHQCKGCGVKFKTISLLERHIKKCDGKEKFKDLKVMKSSVNEMFHQKHKHACVYCDREFTYPKTLFNHFKAFCSVKKEKVRKGGLIQAETDREADMIQRLKQHEENRKLRHDVNLGPQGPKKGWPKGLKRKPRRKNHAWTYIKRRKSSTNQSASNGGEDGAGENGQCEEEEEESEAGDEKIDEDVSSESDEKLKGKDKSGSDEQGTVRIDYLRHVSTSGAIAWVDMSTSGKDESDPQQDDSSRNGPNEFSGARVGQVSNVKSTGYVFKDSLNQQTNNRRDDCELEKQSLLAGDNLCSGNGNKVPKRKPSLSTDQLSDLPSPAKKPKKFSEVSVGIKNSAKSVENSGTTYTVVRGGKLEPHIIQSVNMVLCSGGQSSVMDKSNQSEWSSYGSDPDNCVIFGVNESKAKGRGKVEEAGEKKSAPRGSAKESVTDGVNSKKLTFHVYDGSNFVKNKASRNLKVKSSKSKFHVLEEKDFAKKFAVKNSGKNKQNMDGLQKNEGVRSPSKKDILLPASEKSPETAPKSFSRSANKSPEKVVKMASVIKKKPDKFVFHSSQFQQK